VSTTSVRVDGANPVAVTEMLYVPGFNAGNVKLPDALTAPAVLKCVVVSSATKVAFGTTAPVGSVT
jgi:hypothetical protein